MAEKLTHTTEIQERMIRVLLADNQAVADIAMQMELTPRELRNVLQEGLLHFGDTAERADDRIPIATHPPAAIVRMAAAEARPFMNKNDKEN